MEGKKHSKLAKGKKIFTTQLREDLIDELKVYSEDVGIPMTLLLEKFIEFGLEKSKKTGTIPVNSKNAEW